MEIVSPIVSYSLCKMAFREVLREVLKKNAFLNTTCIYCKASGTNTVVWKIELGMSLPVRNNMPKTRCNF
jgi:hypothetical protein